MRTHLPFALVAPSLFYPHRSGRRRCSILRWCTRTCTCVRVYVCVRSGAERPSSFVRSHSAVAPCRICIPSHWPYSGLIGCIGRYSTDMIHVRAVCGVGGGVVAGRRPRRSAAGGQGIDTRRGRRLTFPTNKTRQLAGASVEREIEIETAVAVVETSMLQQQQQSQQQPRPRPRNALGKTVALVGLAGFSLVVSSGLLSSLSSPIPPGPFASLALAVPTVSAVSAVSAEAMATAFRSAWAGLAAGWVLNDRRAPPPPSDSLTRATRFARSPGVCIHWLERIIWLR